MADESDFLKQFEQARMLAQMFQSMATEKADSGAEPTRFFDYDMLTAEMRIVKAAIPYLALPYRQNMAVFLKMLELRQLTTQAPFAQTQAETRHGPREMLSAIRPHLHSERQNAVDMLIKFLEMKEITDMFSNFQKQGEL